MAYIQHSKDESGVFGLNFGRGTLNNHDWTVEDLRNEITAGKYDMVRIKIKSDRPDIFEKLGRIGFPFTLYSIILRNKIEIAGQEFFNETELHFELFDGSNIEILQNLVRECITHPTATNYRDEVDDYFIPLEKEHLASDHYVQTFNYLIHPHHTCWLIKKNEKYIGYVFGSVNKDEFEGIFYGLIPEYRGTRRYSKMIQRFLKSFCREKKLHFFANDVVFQNFPSLRSIISEGILPVDSYLNICLKPFLKCSKDKALISTLNSRVESFPELQKFIINESLDEGWIQDFRSILLGKADSIVTIRTSFPMVTDKLNIKVVQVFDKQNQLIAYFQFQTLKRP